MPPPFYISLIISAASLIFAAGGLYYGFRALKKDVDGVGRKVNQLDKEREESRRRILTAFLLISTDQEREKIANLLNR